MSWRAICRWNRQASFACACWIAGASRTFSRGSSHTSARTPLRWRQYLNKRRLSNLSWRALIAQLFEAQGLANAALYWCLTATGGSIVRSLARFSSITRCADSMAAARKWSICLRRAGPRMAVAAGGAKAATSLPRQKQSCCGGARSCGRMRCVTSRAAPDGRIRLPRQLPLVPLLQSMAGN